MFPFIATLHRLQHMKGAWQDVYSAELSYWWQLPSYHQYPARSLWTQCQHLFSCSFIFKIQH